MRRNIIWLVVATVLFTASISAGSLYIKKKNAKPVAAKNYKDQEITLPEKVNNKIENKDSNTSEPDATHPATPPNPATPDTPSKLPSAQKPATPEVVPDENDKTIYSWWFTRNKAHKPVSISSLFSSLIPGKAFYLGNTNSKKVYLTFDEGYENGFTPRILDTLKNNNVHATFFVTQDFIDKNPQLVKRMAEERHVIGNHTATHPSLPTLTNQEIIREFQVVKDKVSNLTGQKTVFMRPPKGDFNARVLYVARQQGYYTIFWSMAYKDWDTANQPGRDAALQHVLQNVHPGAIILLHAVSQSNTEALDDIIKNLQAQGYSFGSLNELL